MPYAEIYSHKQDMTPGVQGANQQLSNTQSPSVNNGLTVKGGIGLLAIERQLAPVFKQGLTSYVQATGNAKLARNIGYIESATGVLITTLTLGAGVALGALAISTTTKVLGNLVNENIAQVEQEYNLKIKGARNKRYISAGGYYG